MQHKDIVSKNTLKRLVLDMGTYLFDLDLIEVEILGEEQQRIETRRADLVVGATDRAGTHFILHIEVQNQNDATMPMRMMRYYSDIALAYPGQEIRQYLIYIVPGRKLTISLVNCAETVCSSFLHRVIYRSGSEIGDNISVMRIITDFDTHSSLALFSQRSIGGYAAFFR